MRRIKELREKFLAAESVEELVKIWDEGKEPEPIPAPVPVPDPPKPKRKRSNKKAWELAQDAKNEYERCTTDAEKIARFGANSRGNPSLFQAYAWYAEHYEQSDGRPLTAKGLQNSLYQHRFPPK